MADRAVEIITGRERRRRWSVEDKLKIVAETLEPGASVNQIAARHGVYLGLLLTQRRQNFRDEMAGWLQNLSRYANGGTDKPFWLEAYNGGPYQIDRQKYPVRRS